MKRRLFFSVVYSLALALLLCACNTPKERPPVQFTSQGTILTVPAMFADLITVNTDPTPGQRSTFFSVHETASLEAAKEIAPDNTDAGFLFGIGTVDDTTFMEMMCEPMTGADVFARDEAGNYYMFYFPTDVQLVRNGEITTVDRDQWFSLYDWGLTVSESFLTDNPHLIPYSRTYTDLDLVLSRIAHRQLEITLSPYDGDYMYASSGEQSAPFLAQFLDEIEFLPPDEDFTPGGEYIKLSIPTLVWTFDFFTGEGNTHYIRQTFGDAGDAIWVATRNGEPFPLADIIAQWTDSVKAVSPPEIKVPPMVSTLIPLYEQHPY